MISAFHLGDKHLSYKWKTKKDLTFSKKDNSHANYVDRKYQKIAKFWWRFSGDTMTKPDKSPYALADSPPSGQRKIKNFCLKRLKYENNVLYLQRTPAMNPFGYQNLCQ